MQSRDSDVRQAAALLEWGRQAEGLVALHRLAAEGDGAALRMLGSIHWGRPGDADAAIARDLFERAAAAGDREAELYVTNLLASGIAGPRDWPGALARLRREAAATPARAAALKVLAGMKLDAAGDPLALPHPQRLSETPDIVKFAGLFTAAECAYLIAAVRSSFRPSTVISQGREMLDPVRSSHGATLHWLIEDPAVHALNRRVAAASGTTVEQGEAAQILRYRPGQEYRTHFDHVPGAANQRIATALVWLNHDFTGGETFFPRTGAKLRGRKGDAFVFRNALPDGTRDPMSEHAGRPVTSGTKYIYSRWIRARRWQP